MSDFSLALSVFGSTVLALLYLEGCLSIIRRLRMTVSDSMEFRLLMGWLLSELLLLSVREILTLMSMN